MSKYKSGSQRRVGYVPVNIKRMQSSEGWHGEILLPQILEIIEETYADQLPLSVRQIFYILVNNYDYPKLDAFANRVGDVLERFRRGRLVPFKAIRDDTVVERWPQVFDGPSAFWDEVRDDAQRYRRDKLADQGLFIELWTEARGSVPQLVSTAFKYGVPVISPGGQSSITGQWELSQRIADERDTIERAIVLHVGDYDKHGMLISNKVRDEAPAFLHEDAPEVEFVFERVAITKEQIKRHKLQTHPGKSGVSVELEAVDPRLVSTLVDDAIQRQLNPNVLAESLRSEAADRDRIIATIPD